MRKFLAMGVLACLGALMGCGGSGSSIPSPFVGDWVGTWSVGAPVFLGRAITHGGTVTLTIDEDGEFSGTIVDEVEVPPATGTIEGRVNANGTVTTATYYSEEDQYSGTGVWELNEEGDIVGTVTDSESGNVVTYTLSPQGLVPVQ